MSRTMLVCSTLAVVLALGSTAAAQSASVAPRPDAARPAAPPLPSDYVIGPEDVLFIHVWKNEALSRELPVRPDGKISLPLLHDVHAAGLTPMQLRNKLATALSEFMPNAEVSVTVLQVNSYKVSVLGEVQRPGILQLKAPTTVLEALALAGGFQPFASPSKIVIFRKDAKGETRKIRFNYNRAIDGAAGEENLVLRAGDVIVVP
ncbi:MAG TPA: polysaccharide biosynthesis/export family protein [Candidatus Tectomicrobia bacterium]|nr:polysaccharide biosynthesis/export family protein [Candidatus Tectomicrobia bacterium]